MTRVHDNPSSSSRPSNRSARLFAANAASSTRSWADRTRSSRPAPVGVLREPTRAGLAAGEPVGLHTRDPEPAEHRRLRELGERCPACAARVGRGDQPAPGHRRRAAQAHPPTTARGRRRTPRAGTTSVSAVSRRQPRREVAVGDPDAHVDHSRVAAPPRAPAAPACRHHRSSVGAARGKRATPRAIEHDLRHELFDRAHHGFELARVVAASSESMTVSSAAPRSRLHAAEARASLLPDELRPTRHAPPDRDHVMIRWTTCRVRRSPRRVVQLGSRTRAATTGQSGHHRQQTRSERVRSDGTSELADRRARGHPAPLDAHVQGAAPEKAGIVEPDPRTALGAERERGTGLPPTRRRAHHEDRVRARRARATRRRASAAPIPRGTSAITRLTPSSSAATTVAQREGGTRRTTANRSSVTPASCAASAPRVPSRSMAAAHSPTARDRGRELEGDRSGPCSRDVALDAQHRSTHEGAAGDQLAQIPREPD